MQIKSKKTSLSKLFYGKLKNEFANNSNQNVPLQYCCIGLKIIIRVEKLKIIGKRLLKKIPKSSILEKK